MDFTTYSFSDQVTALLFALLLNLALGGPASFWRRVHLPYPGQLFYTFVHGVERRLNRNRRSERVRKMRGQLFVIFMVVVSLLLGGFFHWVSLHIPYGILLEIALVALLIPARLVLSHAGEIASQMGDSWNAMTRRVVRAIARRSLAMLDRHALARATIEHLADHFSGKIVASVFWYIIGGLPALIAIRVIAEMDAIIGYRSVRLRAFGRATAILDDIIRLLPARITAGVIIIAAMFVPGCRPSKAVAIVWRDADRLTSPNTGWPLSAMAGALGISLGGPRTIHGSLINDPWIGDGSAKTSVQDLHRARYLYLVSCLVLVVLLAATLTFL